MHRATCRTLTHPKTRGAGTAQAEHGAWASVVDWVGLLRVLGSARARERRASRWIAWATTFPSARKHTRGKACESSWPPRRIRLARTRSHHVHIGGWVYIYLDEDVRGTGSTRETNPPISPGQHVVSNHLANWHAAARARMRSDHAAACMRPKSRHVPCMFADAAHGCRWHVTACGA